MKITMNDVIGVEPYPTNSIQVKMGTGFATVAQKTELTKLKVLIGNSTVPTGSFVYVQGETCKLPFATKIFNVEDIKFILLPVSFIQVLDTNA